MDTVLGDAPSEESFASSANLGPISSSFVLLGVAPITLAFRRREGGYGAGPVTRGTAAQGSRVARALGAEAVRREVSAPG